MRIEHIAIWVKDLEKMKDFYIKYFRCKANDKYINKTNNFESYFLSFTDGARIELMRLPSVKENQDSSGGQYQGIAHFAIKLGNREKVDRLTKQLELDGYKIFSYPRETGDGYYESCIFDPEMNRVELVG